MKHEVLRQGKGAWTRERQFTCSAGSGACLLVSGPPHLPSLELASATTLLITHLARADMWGIRGDIGTGESSWGEGESLAFLYMCTTHPQTRACAHAQTQHEAAYVSSGRRVRHA